MSFTPSTLPEGWTTSRLGFVATVKARLGWKGLTASEYVNEGYIFLATPNIKGREIDFDDVNYITAERYFESPEIMLQVGDVLLAKDGSTLGICAPVRHLPRPATVNGSIAVIRPKPQLDSVYLFYLLTSAGMQSRIQQFKDGMGVPHLFQSDIRKFPTILPPLQEQRGIADFLDRETVKIDAVVGARLRSADLTNGEECSPVHKLLRLLLEYRSALISAAVTGQIDVRNHKSQEVASCR